MPVILTIEAPAVRIAAGTTRGSGGSTDGASGWRTARRPRAGRAAAPAAAGWPRPAGPGPEPPGGWCRRGCGGSAEPARAPARRPAPGPAARRHREHGGGRDHRAADAVGRTERRPGDLGAQPAADGLADQVAEGGEGEHRDQRDRPLAEGMVGRAGFAGRFGSIASARRHLDADCRAGDEAGEQRSGSSRSGRAGSRPAPTAPPAPPAPGPADLHACPDSGLPGRRWRTSPPPGRRQRPGRLSGLESGAWST